MDFGSLVVQAKKKNKKGKFFFLIKLKTIFCFKISWNITKVMQPKIFHVASKTF